MLERSQEVFGREIAAPLRVAVRPDPRLAERVMQAVREEHHRAESERSLAAHQPWWRRSIAVRVTPLGGLALAAGLAALVLGGAELLSAPARASTPPPAVAHRADTVHVVRFVFVAPGASSVALVGDFNHWDLGAHRLASAAPGVWSASVPLNRGRHEYAFVIDGTRWVADPAATSVVADEFGGESSVITVGAPRPSSI